MDWEDLLVVDAIYYRIRWSHIHLTLKLNQEILQDSRCFENSFSFELDVYHTSNYYYDDYYKFTTKVRTAETVPCSRTTRSDLD